MTFDNLAKDLLAKRTAPTSKDALGRANVLIELSNNGFSVGEVIQEIRALYDNTEDDGIRKQLLDMIIKVQGLYKEEDRKEQPRITFNIIANEKEMNEMLCPPLEEVA